MTIARAKGSPIRQRGRGEFRVYFWAIFAMSLVFSTFGWAFDVISTQTLDLPGPIARAYSAAHQITPIIFSV